MPLKPELIERATELLIQGLGQSLKDPNYRDTPERVTRMYQEMFAPRDHDFVTFPEAYANLILLRNHQMYSMCPHHLLPVFFKVHVAYIPDGKVLGLSKLARLLDDCNTGPLLQEKFTGDVIAKVLQICKKAKGAACLIEGEHGCMKVRGVKSSGSIFTYSFSGEFKTNSSLEQLFFQLVTKKE